MRGNPRRYRSRYAAPSLLTVLGGELVSHPEIGYGGGLSRINRRLAKVALERASLVSVGSSHLAQLAKPRAAKTTWLPIGVDLERFHPASKAGETSPLEGGIKLLHVASLVPVKGQDSLLRAFEKVTLSIPTRCSLGRKMPTARISRVPRGRARDSGEGALSRRRAPPPPPCLLPGRRFLCDELPSRRTGTGDARGRRLRTRHYRHEGRCRAGSRASFGGRPGG